MDHQKTRAIFSGCAWVALMTLWGCVPADLTEEPTVPNNNTELINPVKGDMAAIMRGQASFDTTCKGCHNIDGSPGPVAPRGLTDTAATLTDGAIFTIIKDGSPTNPSMAAYGGQFSDDQIWDMAAFIQSFATGAPNNTTANNTTTNNTTANNMTSNNMTSNNTSTNNTSAGTNPLDGDADAIASGEITFDSACTTCHNKDGSMGPVSPKALSDTAVNLTDAEVYSKISDGVPGTSMSAYGANYSETEIWQIVSWIRTLAP